MEKQKIKEMKLSGLKILLVECQELNELLDENNDVQDINSNDEKNKKTREKAISIIKKMSNTPNPTPEDLEKDARELLEEGGFSEIITEINATIQKCMQDKDIYKQKLNAELSIDNTNYTNEQKIKGGYK